jgi:IMP dehydrogenase
MSLAPIKDAIPSGRKAPGFIVVNPVTAFPTTTLAAALTLMKTHQISSLLVVESGGGRTPGRLVGILTSRDVRFATDPNQPVFDLMTRKVVTVHDSDSIEDSKRLLHQHRIEKLPVVDEEGRCWDG